MKFLPENGNISANSAQSLQPRSGEIIVAEKLPFPFPPIEHKVFGSSLKDGLMPSTLTKSKIKNVRRAAQPTQN